VDIDDWSRIFDILFIVLTALAVGFHYYATFYPINITTLIPLATKPAYYLSQWTIFAIDANANLTGSDTIQGEASIAGLPSYPTNLQTFTPEVCLLTQAMFNQVSTGGITKWTLDQQSLQPCTKSYDYLGNNTYSVQFHFIIPDTENYYIAVRNTSEQPTAFPTIWVDKPRTQPYQLQQQIPYVFDISAVIVAIIALTLHIKLHIG